MSVQKNGRSINQQCFFQIDGIRLKCTVLMVLTLTIQISPGELDIRLQWWTCLTDFSLCLDTNRVVILRLSYFHIFCSYTFHAPISNFRLSASSTYRCFPKQRLRCIVLIVPTSVQVIARPDPNSWHEIPDRHYVDPQHVSPPRVHYQIQNRCSRMYTLKE